jgi:hypothetical protein
LIRPVIDPMEEVHLVTDPTTHPIRASYQSGPGQPVRVMGRAADRFGAVFYGSVALLALAGQTGAAMSWLRWPLVFALPAVAVVELGGIALAARADFRRRLGERAIAARVLSAAVAAFAVAFNWLGHGDHLAGGFFAGMSGLGYAVWLINSADRRRDQLRAANKLAPTPPAYGLAQWLRHPWITRRARALAKADPRLGLFASLVKAETQLRVERRNAALAKALQRRIAAAVDPTMAKIAVLTYDLDEIAVRLRETADYDGLTGLLAADLTASRLAAGSGSSGPRPTNGAGEWTAPRFREPAMPPAQLVAADAPALTDDAKVEVAPVVADRQQIPGVSPQSVAAAGVSAPLPVPALNGVRAASLAAAAGSTDALAGPQGLDDGYATDAPAKHDRPASAAGAEQQVSDDGPRQRGGEVVRQRSAAGPPRMAARGGAASGEPVKPVTGRREVANAEEARQVYLASVASGKQLTGRQLGAMYGRSPAWGRERIGEVKRAASAAPAATR